MDVRLLRGAHADVAEAASAGPQPTPVEHAELVTRGRAPPAWRRDDFPAAGPVRRSVWTLPYSLRPPDKEPEEWISLNQKAKDELRARWQLRDPEGFAAQELRRKQIFEKNREGTIPKISVALPVLQCKMFLDSENGLFYHDPCDIRNPTVAWLLDRDVEQSIT